MSDKILNKKEVAELAKLAIKGKGRKEKESTKKFKKLLVDQGITTTVKDGLRLRNVASSLGWKVSVFNLGSNRALVVRKG
jgi:hypothetical protein